MLTLCLSLLLMITNSQITDSNDPHVDLIASASLPVGSPPPFGENWGKYRL